MRSERGGASEVSQRVLEARVLETGHRLLTLEQAKRAKQIEMQASC